MRTVRECSEPLKNDKKSPTTRPADKPKKGPVPITGFDPSKSFDSGRFCPTNFTAFFFSRFWQAQGGPGRPREAQGGPGRPREAQGGCTPMVRWFGKGGVLYNSQTAACRVRCQVASRRGESSPSRRQVWRETVRLGQVACA